MNILYAGPLHLITGIGEASRNHAKALKRVGAVVLGRDTTRLHPALHIEILKDDHEINEICDPKFAPQGDQTPHDVVIWHTTPDATVRMGDKPNLIFAVWECQGLPDGWADYINALDGLLTASEFSAKIFRDGGVTVPIEVVPHPIDIDRFYPQVDGSAFRSQYRVKTLFLSVAQWMFRKGMDDLLIAYLTEFTDRDDVGLALLTWGGSHRYPEREKIKRAICYIRKSLNIDHQPPVWFIEDKVPPLRLPEVYAAADVHVSATRAEAFLIPAFEAAAVKRPSIFTGWGGQVDLLGPDAAWHVPYELEPVHGANATLTRHYTGHQTWARISLNGLRKAMREAYEHPELREAKAEKALEVVLDNLSFPAIGTRTLEAIEKILSKKNLDTAQLAV